MQIEKYWGKINNWKEFKWPPWFYLGLAGIFSVLKTKQRWIKQLSKYTWWQYNFLWKYIIREAIHLRCCFQWCHFWALATISLLMKNVVTENIRYHKHSPCSKYDLITIVPIGRRTWLLTLFWVIFSQNYDIRFYLKEAMIQT